MSDHIVGYGLEMDLPHQATWIKKKSSHVFRHSPFMGSKQIWVDDYIYMRVLSNMSMSQG